MSYKLINNGEVDEKFGVVSSRIRLKDSSKSCHCIFEGFLRCYYSFVDERGKTISVEYLMTVRKDKFRPYGIKSILRDEKNRITDEYVIENKFSTVSECIIKMHMLAQEKILPCTIGYII